MKTETVFPIKITFDIPVAPDKTISRFVYSYLLDCGQLYLIDTGVAGAENDISEALGRIGKGLSDIDMIILTHSHPDHIGSASLIQSASNAEVCAHHAERRWIENVDIQAEERPVPGFSSLVSRSLKIDRLLRDGDVLPLRDCGTLEVLHTPGHSAGSISLLLPQDGILISGDVIPQPGDMPIYEDVGALATSLARLAQIENLTTLYSSWAESFSGPAAVYAILEGIRYLKTVHSAVMKVDSECQDLAPMELCKRCVRELDLPPFALNPLVARSLLAHRQASASTVLDHVLRSIREGDKHA